MLLTDLFIDFGELHVTEDELQWLHQACPYFARDYLDYLRDLRFKPEQVKVTFTPQPEDKDLGRVEIEATGPWIETILWEVPLMAVLSELHFMTGDTDWNYDGQEGELNILFVIIIWLLNRFHVGQNSHIARVNSYSKLVASSVNSEPEDDGRTIYRTSLFNHF